MEEKKRGKRARAIDLILFSRFFFFHSNTLILPPTIEVFVHSYSWRSDCKCVTGFESRLMDAMGIALYVLWLCMCIMQLSTFIRLLFRYYRHWIHHLHICNGAIIKHNDAENRWNTFQSISTHMKQSNTHTHTHAHIMSLYVDLSVSNIVSNRIKVN